VQSPTADNISTEEMVKKMPSHSKKNNHCGIVARGSMRHRSAQVAADKAHEKEAREQKGLEETNNLQAFAQLSVKTDEHWVLWKSRAVQRISDIPEEDDERVSGKVNDNGGEEYKDNAKEESDDNEGRDMYKDGTDDNLELEVTLPKTQTKKERQVSQH
jgi:hypothetical protein